MMFGCACVHGRQPEWRPPYKTRPLTGGRAVIQCFTMIKTITRIGNSKGIILDAALLELAHLKEGDQLSVTVHDSGAITFSPTRAVIDAEAASNTTQKIVEQNDELFRRLSK